MREDFTVKKRVILVVLAMLIAGDLALGFYSWQLSNAPYTSQKDFEAQLMKVKVLRGDIKKAQDIKDNMPATKDDCEKFEKSLPPQSIGSSSMVSDLDDIAKKAGLQVSSLAFKPKDLPDHGMTEVDIDATISGDYNGVAHFLNDLQRSQKFYIVDGLALGTDSQNKQANGLLRVAIHVRTYLREAA